MAMWKVANGKILVFLLKELNGDTEFESWFKVQSSYLQAGIVNHKIL